MGVCKQAILKPNKMPLKLMKCAVVDIPLITKLIFCVFIYQDRSMIRHLKLGITSMITAVLKPYMSKT